MVLLILGKFAWGPICEGLQKRESEIAGQIAEAQRKNEEAGNSWPNTRRSWPPRRTRSAALWNRAGTTPKRSAGNYWTRPVKEAAASAAGRGEMESATLAALKELAERSPTLAVELAGKSSAPGWRPGP